mmetsp:Transcript_2890/g.7048  ORF Transcript_2890/g.7048 Transcript_2890/m.7048 type:complete len:314 (+) Transcript_2890:199-1140(+)|eukprot:CAMPEP_0177645788 /NCGR_PEP_ID=MMETSP0447-20121125/9434_1 /TAXON_ID=0 /ORGANISM="Stygamoeba regulata, Strain BSH-02190019" /LENGTH=313 /DNA_ID=CAMNT_0019148291 /DNA_START=255 /DNA_END=1196 /DNA_ORIENTATION=+
MVQTSRFALLAAVLLIALLGGGTIGGAHATKSWSQLRALFPGQPGQPTDYAGVGTFRLAEWAIPPSVDNSDYRYTYDENFIIKFEADGSHRLEFFVNYLDAREVGSILYPAAIPFGPYIEVSVEIDEYNRIDVDTGCKYNLNSLPDILSPEFWEFTTGFGIEFVDVRDYRGQKCDYFEGVIPGDPAAGVPDTVIGWYNRYTSATDIEKYGPLQYFLGPAQFEQTGSTPNPSLLMSEDHLTRLISDRFPATYLCRSITDPFLADGTLPAAKRGDNNNSTLVSAKLRSQQAPEEAARSQAINYLSQFSGVQEAKK